MACVIQMGSLAVMRTAFLPLTRCLILLCAVAGGARGDILPPLSPQDAAKWGAVGVVNIEGATGLARCTGTLIAPALVLTAAHCAPLDPSLRVFVPGGIAPDAKAYEIIKTQHHPAYATLTGMSKFRVDQALITLKTPIAPAVATPLAITNDSVEAAELAIVAFHRMRPAGLNGRIDCPLVEGRGLILRCQVIAGNSGAPALVLHKDGWNIAGVVVARLDAGEEKQALIAPVGAWVQAKLAAHIRARE